MKHQYHSGSSDSAAPGEAAKLRALISDLDRVVRILDSHISIEEERAGVSNPFSAPYPILARVIDGTPGQPERDNSSARTATLLRTGRGSFWLTERDAPRRDHVHSAKDETWRLRRTVGTGKPAE